ncbi:MAG: hypothetical protein COA78_17380 [Blastopirellula sp.]|nr:MAG: hypothetical protein COA78_17380 [Blastopirellula sp.]
MTVSTLTPPNSEMQDTMYWENQTADFLRQLSDVQRSLMQVLSDKRAQMVASDVQAMETTQVREQELVDRLTLLREDRQELLRQAAEQGLPGDSIRSLASVVNSGKQGDLNIVVKDATNKMRHIQNETLTNFVLAQQTVLHLSQILQIIASGGKIEPTYEKENSANQGGTLVDQQA